MLALACDRGSTLQGETRFRWDRRESDGPFLFWGRYLHIPDAITIKDTFVTTQSSFSDGDDLTS